MYGTDEDINKNKRRMLLISIIVVVVLMLFVFILLIAKKNGTNSNNREKKELHCELGVAEGVDPDNEGVYNEEIEIVFKSIDADLENTKLMKKTIGTSDSSLNKDTYKIITDGNYTINGYIEDEYGNTGTCQLNVEVRIGNPTCTLEATSNFVGENDWYIEDVEVSFKDMSTNNKNSEIVKYFIEKTGEKIDVQTRENNSVYKVNTEEEVNLTGYIIDSQGRAGACTINVKKDSTPPTCTLKVENGTKNENGIYTSAPTIVFESASDNITQNISKGVGLNKNYTDEKYILNNNGKYTVYGYVKDEAGNEGICSLSLEVEDGRGVTDTQPPSCLLYIKAGNVKLETEDTYVMYEEGRNNIAKVYMETSPNTTAYGIGVEETFNGSKEYLITKPGKYTISGYVKNARGETAYCTTPRFEIKGTLLRDVVKEGDYVTYDINYTQTRCSTNDKTSFGGWRVLDVTRDNKVVLISGGITDCIEHGTSSISTINEMNEKAKKYKSEKYAESAVALNCESVNAKGCKYSLADLKLYNIGTNYLMASSASNTELWAINQSGIPEQVKNSKYGMRVVVTLSPYVVTQGKVNGTWVISR